jgi:DNA-binding HxlR family transcriptional regulator
MSGHSQSKDSVVSPNASTPPADPESRAALFKALGHPTRLLILNLIRQRARHGEELAAILRASPATVSHHLSKLAEVGLVRAERDQYTQDYRLAGDLYGRTLAELITLSTPAGQRGLRPDAYHDKVLKAFMDNGRLVRIPAQRKKRRVILELLAEDFEPGRDYPEAEVNAIIRELHHDVETLRRELIMEKLMTRERGVYRRVVEDEASS